MAATQPSEFRLTPARAGLKAVAVPQGRNIQAGTAILNIRGIINVFEILNFRFDDGHRGFGGLHDRNAERQFESKPKREYRRLCRREQFAAGTFGQPDTAVNQYNARHSARESGKQDACGHNADAGNSRSQNYE